MSAAASSSVTPARPPNDDPAWRGVEAAMRRHGYDGHALIETLHAVQHAFGYISAPAMRYVAGSLGLPYSKVFGVATFYHLFTLYPPARHDCVVCLGTTCYIKGSQKLLNDIARRFGILEGQATADGQFALLSARCIGTCGLAPTATIDGEVVGKEPPQEVIHTIERHLSS